MSAVSIERHEVAAPDWGFTMNAYVVRDSATGATAIVDPGAEPARLLDAAGSQVTGIWVTHADFDHVAALAEVRAATGAPVLAHRLEVDRVPGGVDTLVAGGDTVQLGSLPVQVRFVPGHAPGHVVFIVGRHVLGGDVLFPGGPGRTRSPEDFQTLLRGIETQLLALDDDATVHPGHGDPVTIGQARREIAAFRQRGGTEALYGDVTWLESGEGSV